VGRFTIKRADLLYKSPGELAKDRAYAVLQEQALRQSAAAGKQSTQHEDILIDDPGDNPKRSRYVVNSWVTDHMEDLVTRGTSPENLADEANISLPTLRRIRQGQPVRPFTMQAVIEMLSRRLKTAAPEIQSYTRAAATLRKVS